MVEWFIDNWIMIVIFVALALAIILWAVDFFSKPRDEQFGKVREWLLYAVTEAEKQFGDGTGQLKLRVVYDQFVARFPDLYRFISFDTFSIMVDDALMDMRRMLETNPEVAAIVEEKSEPVAIISVSSDREEGI